MPEVDDLNVNGQLLVRGLPPVRQLALVFVLGGTPPTVIASDGLTSVTRNGVGDYTVVFANAQTPLVAFCGSYLAFDGIPGTVTFVPNGPGSSRVLMFHATPPISDGAPVDGAFGIIIASVT